MKRQRLSAIIPLISLLLVLLITPASAQGPTALSGLTLKFWPEYDDPRLLVIIDGQLATPGSEIRLPIPAEAQLNAVATSDGGGHLLKNDWREEKSKDGNRLLVMTPANPLFRVEYYTPLSTDGDKRTIDFELPAGYINAEQASIEILLPPGSADVTLTPPADDSGASQDQAHLFTRTLGKVTDQAISQQVRYSNPSGALTVSESAAGNAANAQPQATAAAPQSEPASPKKSSLNPWIIILGVAALLLIIGGAVGLWLTSNREDEEEIRPLSHSKGKKKKAGAVSLSSSSGKQDRFCRQCGKAFGPDDRFCRYCGAPRKSL